MGRSSPHEAGIVISHLSRAMLAGSRDLKTVPILIKRIIRDHLWESWSDPSSGRGYGPFTSFEAFVTQPATTGGLGSSIKQLLGLCGDDPEARDDIDAELKRNQPHGGNTLSIVPNVHDGSARPSGNTEAAGLRRLRRYRPDLLQRVRDKEISTNSALIEAGFRHRQLQVRADDPNQVSKILRKHYSMEDREIIAMKLLE